MNSPSMNVPIGFIATYNPCVHEGIYYAQNLEIISADNNQSPTRSDFILMYLNDSYEQCRSAPNHHTLGYDLIQRTMTTSCEIGVTA